MLVLLRRRSTPQSQRTCPRRITQRIMTVTKHPRSSIALRGSHRLPARPCPIHPNASTPGRSRRPPAAVLGARPAYGGQPIGIRSSREAAEQVHCHLAPLDIQAPQPPNAVAPTPQGLWQAIYIASSPSALTRGLGVSSGAGRRPLKKLSLATPAPAPLGHACPTATRGWIAGDVGCSLVAFSRETIHCAMRYNIIRVGCESPSQESGGVGTVGVPGKIKEGNHRNVLAPGSWGC